MDNISRSFNCISRATREIKRRENQQTGLGPGEIRTLRFITFNPGATQQDISNRFGINKAATARQCASLEEKGLITRTENKKDGRSKLLFTTEKAEKMRIERHMNEERIYDELLAVLTDDEKAELVRLLNKVADRVADSIFSKYGGKE